MRSRCRGEASCIGPDWSVRIGAGLELDPADQVPGAPAGVTYLAVFPETLFEPLAAPDEGPSAPDDETPAFKPANRSKRS